ncbi:hypothetical protein BDV96DRAFT_644323 [Lophiotrema nucula]|uniref:Ubiquitin-like domain-containing protein n=1 Tax=Lophiotrema nucula TaxID=690887 RepID=A0A6A5ZER3_9PLEO|nr:hypothetical protein BDV96DRAFT_644323 [Lophiotrema nucula]
MTDPLSVAASVLTLATTGFAIAKGLYHIANEIGSAGEEVRLYSQEVDGTCQVLQNILFALEEHHAQGIVYEQILLASIVSVCSRLMEPLHRLQIVLVPLLDKFKRSVKKLYQVGLKLKWVFSTRSKLLLCRALISNLRGDLHMLLTLLLIRKGSDNGSAKGFMLRESLKSSIAAHSVRKVDVASLGDETHEDHFEVVNMPFDVINRRQEYLALGHGLDQIQILQSHDLAKVSSTHSDDSDVVSVEIISSPSISTDGALDETELRELNQAIEASLACVSNTLLENIEKESDSIGVSVVRLASGILRMPASTAFTNGIHTAHASSAPADNGSPSSISHHAPLQKLYLRLDQNTYDLPLYKFRYWHQMDAFLQDLYRPHNFGKGIGTSPARSTLREAIMTRHFYFQTEEGKRIVLPEFWEDIVRPEAGADTIKLELRIHD